MVQIAASTYVIVIAGVIVFQICLISGVPWGHLTQGGSNEGALPAAGRIGAGVSILLLGCMGAAITSAAGMAPGWPFWTAWVAVGIQVLSVILNWITPSAAERRLWGPVTTLMLVLAVYVVMAA